MLIFLSFLNLVLSENSKLVHVNVRYKKFADVYFFQQIANLDVLLNFLVDDNQAKSRINVLLIVRVLDLILQLTRSTRIKDYLSEKLKQKLLQMITSIKATKHKKEMDSLYMAKLIEETFNSSYDVGQILRENWHCVYNFEFEFRKSCVDELFLVRKFDFENVLFEDEMFLFCHLVFFFEKNFLTSRKSFKFRDFYQKFYTASLLSKIKMSKSYKLNTRSYQGLLMVSHVGDKAKHEHW